jgi:hypothetical protein
MPDGATHYWYFKRGFLIEIPLSLTLCYFDWKFGAGNLVGYSLGRWIDPDWDIMGTNNAEGRVVNEIPILGHFLYGISSTYGSLFRRHHRSFLTHFPLVSTLIRLIFVFIFPLVIFDSWKINLIGDGWHMFWIGILAGLSQADGIHWYLDMSQGGV